MNKINIKALAIKFCLIFLMGSCTDPFCGSVTESIKSQCNDLKSNCQITLDNTFAFEWDSLYLFDSMLYPEEISRRLGTDCDCEIVTDGERLVVFTKEGQIIEKYTSRCNDVSFVRMRNNGVIAIGKGSLFDLDARMLNSQVHYYLKPVQQD